MVCRMIGRLIAYSAARKQSRAFAPAVAGALREGKLDEAIKIADRFNKSHLAKVVVAGLQEFKAHQMSSEIPGEDIEASRRALDRDQLPVLLLHRATHRTAWDGAVWDLLREQQLKELLLLQQEQINLLLRLLNEQKSTIC